MGKVRDKLWENATKYRIPLTGAFELLPLCNLNCKMCYVRKSKQEVEKAGGLMPAEFWLDMAKQACDKGMLFPLLTGGEPFLRQDFQEIYLGMQQLGMQISINSNGTMIDESMAKWLAKHTPTRINITLYGSSEDSYEKLCGDGAAYNRVIKAVELLKKNRIPVKFNTSITADNLNDMESMINYAKLVDSPIQVATYMFPPIRRDEKSIGINNRLSPEEAGLAKVRADYLQRDSEWFKVQANKYSRFVPVTEEMLNDLREMGNGKMTCRAGRCSFWIDWQGNMTNCGMYPSSQISLLNTDFEKAWEIIVDETEKVEASSICSNCPNNHLCHSCIAMIYNESGSAKGYPKYLCEMNMAAKKYYEQYLVEFRKNQRYNYKDINVE